MASLQEQFLKALMERFPHPGMAVAIGTLPEELGSKFRELPEKVGKAPELFLVQPQRVLKGMHPSWCEELVLLSPVALQPLIRTVVLEAIGKGVQIGIEALAEPVRKFLLGYLVAKWPERNTQGVEGIEGASFLWLAGCDERAIFTLAELLAVNDVVDVVRQIVDKKILQKILIALTPLQQQYLRSLLHRPSRSATLNKELTALLRNDPVAGAQNLMRKGVEELALAMKDEPDLLQWHVLHHIDREKACFFKKVMEKEISPEEQKEMKKHLSHAYQFLQKVETQ
jgi:hypothetical protein